MQVTKEQLTEWISTVRSVDTIRFADKPTIVDNSIVCHYSSLCMNVMGNYMRTTSVLRLTQDKYYLEENVETCKTTLSRALDTLYLSNYTLLYPELQAILIWLGRDKDKVVLDIIEEIRANWNNSKSTTASIYTFLMHKSIIDTTPIDVSYSREKVAIILQLRELSTVILRSAMPNTSIVTKETLCAQVDKYVATLIQFFRC